MVDSSGNILADVESDRQFEFRLDRNVDAHLFRLVKFVLQYNGTYPDNAHVLLVPHGGSGKGRWSAYHRCGETAMRCVRNITLGNRINDTRSGFYTFSGDGGDVVMPSMWQSEIELTLRCRLADARKVCEDHPDFEAAPEWRWLLDHFEFAARASETEATTPTNKYPNTSDRSYYGELAFSRFLKDIYSRSGGKRTEFYRESDLRMFFDPEARYAFVGKRKDILMQSYMGPYGDVEATFFFPMNEEAGYYDFGRFAADAVPMREADDAAV